MDYYKIGQRIRKMRKAHGLSQEQLAERINISTTHMSHIETGSTKLSLPVLVSISVELQVRTDELLFDSASNDPCADTQDVLNILEQCSEKESKLLVELVKGLKSAMDKYL